MLIMAAPAGCGGHTGPPLRHRDGLHGLSDILSVEDSLPPYESREPSLILDEDSDLDLLDDINIDSLLGGPVNWNFASNLAATDPVPWNFKPQCPKGTVNWNFPRVTDLDAHTQWDFRKVSGEDGPVRWSFRRQLPAESDLNWYFIHCLPRESDINWSFPDQLATLRNLTWFLPKALGESTVHWYFRTQLPDKSTINWNFPRQLPDHCTINWNFPRQLPEKNMVNWGFRSQLSHVYRLPLLWGFPKVLTCRPFIRWAFTHQLPIQSSVNWQFEHALESPNAASGIRWTFKKNLELNGSTIRWAFKKNLNYTSDLSWSFPSMVEHIRPVHWHFDRQIDLTPLGTPDRRLVFQETKRFKDRYARSYQVASEEKRNKQIANREGFLATLQPKLNFHLGIPMSFGPTASGSTSVKMALPGVNNSKTVEI